MRLNEFWFPAEGSDDPALRFVLSVINGQIDSTLPELDYDHLLDVCRRMNTQPIVYEKLRTKLSETVQKLPWFQQLRIDTLKMAGACSLRQRTIQAIGGAMRAAGVKPILIKGPAIAHTAYPHPHWRASYDIDLLINPNEWSGANQILEEWGYQATPCLNWGYLSFEKSFTPNKGFPESPLIELHLKLNN